MKHPLLSLVNKERLHDDAVSRALNSAAVSAATTKDKPRKLADGGGLFLLVLPRNKSGKHRLLWRYKYRINGREGLYAVGAMPEISLANARQIHRAARWLVERGIHPAHYVREEMERLEADELRQKKNTFAAVTEAWMERDKAQLSEGTLKQRRRELDNDVLPTLARRTITAIRKDELTRLLHQIQGRAPEVARNVRQYLTGIFDYAQDAGLITGSPVPGPKALKPRNQKPHAALSLDRLNQFLKDVDKADCHPQTRIALRLLMLTAVRKHELICAKWDEFDLDKGEWHIPAGRMKMREAHWVPLSSQAVNLLRELRAYSTGDLLFPNTRNPRKPMAGTSLNAFLGRMGYLDKAKPHGFRSMFSTYCNSANFNPDVIEKCLAHRHKDVIRAKYNRAEYRKEQRDLMQHWADMVDQWQKGAKVLAIGSFKQSAEVVA